MKKDGCKSKQKAVGRVTIGHPCPGRAQCAVYPAIARTIGHISRQRSALELDGHRCDRDGVFIGGHLDRVDHSHFPQLGKPNRAHRQSAADEI